MGDTGEGDASQYAVVPPLLSALRRHGVHVHLQRRDLSGRRHRRLPGPLLPSLLRLPGPDLRRARQPRLVRRPGRLHVPLLRAGAAAAGARGVGEGMDPQLPVEQAGCRRPEGRRRDARPALGSRAAGVPAGALLRDRRRPGAAGRDRHRHHRRGGPRPGRVAAAGLAGVAQAEGAPDRQADLRGRPPPAREDRGRRHGGRDRARPGAQLRRRDRRRHPQLPALPGHAAGRPHDPVHRERRRRRVHARDPQDPAGRSAGRQRGRLPLLSAAR